MTDGSPPNPDTNSKLEKADLLWNEYKYRHELVWKLIFQITIAATIISIIPYTKQEIATKLGELILLLPGVGILLTGLGLLRLIEEMNILKLIRKKHREYQLNLHEITHEKVSSSFEQDVKIYLVLLLLLEFINVCIIVEKVI